MVSPCGGFYRATRALVEDPPDLKKCISLITINIILFFMSISILHYIMNNDDACRKYFGNTFQCNINLLWILSTNESKSMKNLKLTKLFPWF